MIPVAHAGHYAIWILYLLPVLVVIAGVVRSAIMARRQDRDEDEDS
ncbi:MAG TPA: hypothetical protein VMS60_01475 [Solirubrobacterales bacterium]|nr:hypothetical protein [Solirubrobacterales bacterium]